MGAITIQWPANDTLVLPECHLTVPEGLEGSVAVYTIPDANDIGIRYQAFINTGLYEQRPTCASEKFTLICKYDFSTVGDNSIAPLYILEGIVPTVALNVTMED